MINFHTLFFNFSQKRKTIASKLKEKSETKFQDETGQGRSDLVLAGDRDREQERQGQGL